MQSQVKSTPSSEGGVSLASVLFLSFFVLLLCLVAYVAYETYQAKKTADSYSDTIFSLYQKCSSCQVDCKQSPICPQCNT